MIFEEYKKILTERFGGLSFIQSLGVESHYEEIFRAKWCFTKLKQFSFVSESKNITADTIRNYSDACLKYAIKNAKGLPRGWQNGIVSYNVLASKSIEPDAITYVNSAQNKHFSAFEIPIIVDLCNQKIYYPQDNALWGAMYYSYIKDYIDNHFSI